MYARASSVKQKTSIETQSQILRRAYPDGKLFTDTGSGFNFKFKRRRFRAILERSLRGEPVHLVATTSDRITRSGFPLVKHVIELSGGSIELLEEDRPPEQFDVRTLIAFVISYCNSIHGRRSHKRNKGDKGYPKNEAYLVELIRQQRKAYNLAIACFKEAARHPELRKSDDMKKTNLRSIIREYVHNEVAGRLCPLDATRPCCRPS